MTVSTLRPRSLGAALTAGLFISIGASAARAQDKQPFTTEDALNVASLNVQDVTVDGRYIVATRATQRDRKNVDHMRFGDPTYISPSLADVWVIDTETREHISLFDEKVQVRSFAWSPDGSTVAFLLLKGGGGGGGDEYFLHTYDRARNRVREVDIKTDKPIASNSSLMWRRLPHRAPEHFAESVDPRDEGPVADNRGPGRAPEPL